MVKALDYKRIERTFIVMDVKCLAETIYLLFGRKKVIYIISTDIFMHINTSETYNRQNFIN